MQLIYKGKPIGITGGFSEKTVKAVEHEAMHFKFKKTVTASLD